MDIKAFMYEIFLHRSNNSAKNRACKAIWFGIVYTYLCLA